MRRFSGAFLNIPILLNMCAIGDALTIQALLPPAKIINRLARFGLRLLAGEEKGFGYIDDFTPELGMAILPEYRGQGIGTTLLTRLVETAAASYEQISLSVARENPALRLYKRLGFEVVAEVGTSLTMRKRLKARE